MKNRWPLRLFSCALFIASDPTFAAQIEPRSEGSKNSKPLSAKSPQHRLLRVTSIGFSARKLSEPSGSARRYPWKRSIVTTVFWIGEQPSGNNPVPNRSSSWDKDWTKIYTTRRYQIMDEQLLEEIAAQLAQAITLMQPIYYRITKRR